VALLLQQGLDDVELHRELTDLALGLAQRDVLDWRRASLQALAPRRQELLTSHADPTSGLTRLAREEIKRLATQQAHHDPPLRPALQRTSRSPTARCFVRWTSSCAPSIPTSVTLDMLTSWV
jgi:hypothetical protein